MLQATAVTPVPIAFRRPAGASRSRATRPSPSSIRMCSQGWRAAGAEIVPFSPLADEPPPPDCDCCWLPGGYPELHAGRLAAASALPRGLARFRADEAGPWRVRRLHGARQARSSTPRARATPWPGSCPSSRASRERKMQLGYRDARLLADSRARPRGLATQGPRIPLFDASRSPERTSPSRSSPTPMARRRDRQARGEGSSAARSFTPSRVWIEDVFAFLVMAMTKEGTS